MVIWNLLYFYINLHDETVCLSTRHSLCVCPCLCVCVCVSVCVFLHDNSKRNRSRNMKLEYIVEYENIEHNRIKVKVTVALQKFSPFTKIQTVRSYNSTLEQAGSLF